MGETERDQIQAGALTRGRVVASAIHQAARHEHAVKACLTELHGAGQPDGDLTDEVRRRALRHAQRAVGLTRTAVRLNDDTLAEAILAATLERHERTLLFVEQFATSGAASSLPLAS